MPVSRRLGRHAQTHQAFRQGRGQLSERGRSRSNLSTEARVGIRRFACSVDLMRLPHRLTIALLIVATGALRAAMAGPLEDGFAAPPPTARPLVWWHWVNGNVS